MITELGKSLTSTLSNLFKAPVTDRKIDETIQDVCKNLILSNVNPRYVNDLRNSLKQNLQNIPPGYNKAKAVNTAVFDSLVQLLDPKRKAVVLEKGKSQVVVFVGLQGCGKTTSVCKYANFYKKKGFKVGIVCADTFRAGAFDQIKQNALKIKVPYYGSGEADPVKVSSDGVNRFKRDKFDLILVDTSGRHTQEVELFSEMKNIMYAVEPSKIVFVMDAGIGQSAEDQAIGFKNAVDIGSIILTKIDGSSKAGGAISSVAATNCPIEFVGSGEGMDDFNAFEPKRFVSRMLGMGDVEGLIETVADLKIDEKEIINKLKKGNFTLKDFYTQFQQLMSLGPMTKFLEMIPGFSNLPVKDEKEFKKLIYIFDSFSESELDSNGTIFEKQPSRIVRVARGSGSSVQSVADLLVQFRKISSMMGKMASMPGIGDMLSDPSKMSLSQKNKFKKQAQSILPKDLLDQMSAFLK